MILGIVFSVGGKPITPSSGAYLHASVFVCTSAPVHGNVLQSLDTERHVVECGSQL